MGQRITPGPTRIGKNRMDRITRIKATKHFRGGSLFSNFAPGIFMLPILSFGFSQLFLSWCFSSRPSCLLGSGSVVLERLSGSLNRHSWDGAYGGNQDEIKTALGNWLKQNLVHSYLCAPQSNLVLLLSAADLLGSMPQRRSITPIFRSPWWTV